MNRAEAIQKIEAIIDNGQDYGYWTDAQRKALDLAIEALKESADKYTNATTNLYDSRLAKDVMGISEEAEKLQLFGETSTNKSDAESATTTDCISRSDTIKAICAKCTQELYDECREDCTEVAVVKGMPSVSEEEVDYCNNCPYISWGGDCISRQQAIEALTGWQTEPLDEDIVRTLDNLPSVAPDFKTFCGVPIKEAIEVLEKYKHSPSVTPTEQNEEDILKFYYVESLDEYWIGQRCGTRYYGKWTGNCFTYGYSRYLPWGEHVVAPDTLWKEHTYPSEPKEIPFNEWLQGFLEKECQTERTGEWIGSGDGYDWNGELVYDIWECSECGYTIEEDDTDLLPKYCQECGAKMKGGTEND